MLTVFFLNYKHSCFGQEINADRVITRSSHWIEHMLTSLMVEQTTLCTVEKQIAQLRDDSSLLCTAEVEEAMRKC